jgi:predicted metal-dependent hydrolase
MNKVSNTTPHDLQYLQSYSSDVQHKVATLLEQNKLGAWLQSKYANVHKVANDADLRNYVLDLKNQYMKKTQPLSKITYDAKLHIVHQALGLHSYVSRVQGGKLKSKNELRVSSLFKQTPEPFLNMIVAHELAHLKEKAHNKAFYKLCEHIMPSYHQVEFEVRVYLTEFERNGNPFLK